MTKPKYEDNRLERVVIDPSINPETGESRRFRSPYDRVQVKCSTKGSCKVAPEHAHKLETSYIVQNYARTGQLPPHPRGQQPVYADVRTFQQPLENLVNHMQEIKSSVTDALKKTKTKKQKQEKPDTPTTNEPASQEVDE